MRIALVVERYGPAAGGVEQVVWNVAHGLARAGDDVHVIAREDLTHAGGSTPARATGPGPMVHVLPSPIGWQPARVRHFARAARRFLQRAEPRFDVVHSYTRTREQHIYRAGAGSHLDSMRRSYGRSGAVLRMFSPRHRTLLSAEARIFADPGQLIQCVSPMVRAELQRRYRLPDDRLFVLANGVDCDRFHPPSDSESPAAQRLRERFDSKGRVVWLFAGSGARRKGLDTALRALARSGDTDALLWIAGRDSVGPWLRQLDEIGVRDRVRFLGQRDDMDRVYHAVDGLLHPTRYDAFANVTLEAAACGLPVVTSGANGAAQLLADAALVVHDPEDVNDFAGALRSLADPALRRQLGARGRAIALEHQWASHVDALQLRYRDRLERPSDSPDRARGAAA